MFEPVSAFTLCRATDVRAHGEEVLAVARELLVLVSDLVVFLILTFAPVFQSGVDIPDVYRADFVEDQEFSFGALSAPPLAMEPRIVQQSRGGDKKPAAAAGLEVLVQIRLPHADCFSVGGQDVGEEAPLSVVAPVSRGKFVELFLLSGPCVQSVEADAAIEIGGISCRKIDRIIVHQHASVYVQRRGQAVFPADSALNYRGFEPPCEFAAFCIEAVDRPVAAAEDAHAVVYRRG